MKYALIDANNVVQSLTELEDQSNLPEIPVAPTPPTPPTEISPLPENPTDEEVAVYSAAAAQFETDMATYRTELDTFNVDFSAYREAYQAAMKPRYTPPEGFMIVVATDSAVIGATYDGTTFTPPPPPVITYTTDDLLAALATHRYEVSTGGTTVSGIAIQTDPQSQSSLMGAYIMASQNSGYSVEWKTPAGFVTLNAATIIALGNAVAVFVQKCFSSEATVTAAIADYTTVAQVNAAFDTAMST